MPVRVTTNFTVGDRVEFTNEQIMREVGLLARDLIRRRTQRGISADGSAFTPYSPQYRTQKQQQLGKSSPVDLTVSGGMLNALQIVEVTKTTVVLGFT